MWCDLAARGRHSCHGVREAAGEFNIDLELNVD